MGIAIKIEDNTNAYKSSMKSAAKIAMEMCGLTGEGYAKISCPVQTGALRNSISHTVTEKGNIVTVYIGSNMEYAPYVELGTGVYYDGGRKTPWVYQDAKGNWHMTNGQRAQPYIKPAVADHADEYKIMIEDAMRDA